MEEQELNNKINLTWDRMKSGDERAFSEIFTRYYPDLYLYGIKIINLPDLVKDSIQDVFVRIWEKRSTLGTVLSPKAYLIASVRRKLLSNKENYFTEYRQVTLQFEKEENFSFSVTEFKEIDEISQLLRDSLSQAINLLSERQRELIFLRFYYNLKYLEIAQIFEVNEQTVRNLMQRAMAKLREQIDSQLWKGIDNLDELLLTLFCFFQKKY